MITPHPYLFLLLLSPPSIFCSERWCLDTTQWHSLKNQASPWIIDYLGVGDIADRRLVRWDSQY